MELLAVKGDDTGGFLTAMLERVQSERRQRCGIGVPQNAEHPAFLMQGVAVDLVRDAGGMALDHGFKPLVATE